MGVDFKAIELGESFSALNAYFGSHVLYNNTKSTTFELGNSAKSSGGSVCWSTREEEKKNDGLVRGTQMEAIKMVSNGNTKNTMLWATCIETFSLLGYKSWLGSSRKCKVLLWNETDWKI